MTPSVQAGFDALPAQQVMNLPSFLALDELEQVRYLCARQDLAAPQLSRHCGALLGRVSLDRGRCRQFLAVIDEHFSRRLEWAGLRALFLVQGLDLLGEEHLALTLRVLRQRIYDLDQEQAHLPRFWLLFLKTLPRALDAQPGLLEEYFAIYDRMPQLHSREGFARELAPSLEHVRHASTQHHLASRFPAPIGSLLKSAAAGLPLGKDCAPALYLLAGAWCVGRGHQEAADSYYEALTRHGDLARVPTWVVERVAARSHAIEDHALASRLYSHLAERDPWGRGPIMAGVSAFYLGDYPTAQRFLQGRARGRDESLLLLRVWEQMGMTARIPPFLETLPPELLRDGPLRLHFQSLQGRRDDVERTHSLLPEKQVAEIEAKLARQDLVCHPLDSLRRLRQVRLIPVAVSTDSAWAWRALQEALEFFRRELGRGCPRFLLEPLQETEDVGATLGAAWNWNVAGQTLAALKPAARRKDQCQVFFFPHPGPYGSGVASPNQAFIRLGHHQPSASNLLAHELGHAILHLEDVQDTRPLTDGLSLMGYDWNGPVEHTYLGLRFKAACLTPRQAQACVDRGRRAEEKKRWTRALGLYRQALAQDPWHLALALRCVWLFKKLGQSGSAEHLANEVQSRFPSVLVEVRLADILGYRRFRTLPEQLKEEDCRVLAAWHLDRHREQAARPFLRRLPADDPQLLCKQGYARFARGQMTQAWKLFLRALNIAPQDVDCREALAVCSCFLGRRAESDEHFRQARELRGNGPIPAEHHFYPALSRLQWGAMRGALLRLTGKYPENSDWHLTLGIVSQHSGHVEESREAFSKARRLRPAALERAYFAWSRGQLEEASAWARLALRRRRGRPAALELLARLEAHAGWRERLYDWLPTWPSLLIPRLGEVPGAPHRRGISNPSTRRSPVPGWPPDPCPADKGGNHREN